jgi:hypothetical protein
MKCANHVQKEAVGACVGCGRFICEECNTEIGGKSYCKKCVAEMLSDKNNKIEKLEDKTSTNQSQTGQMPMVFMNSGGGGGSSSSSSSSSSAAASGAGGRGLYPTHNIMIHILLFIFTAGIGNVLYFLFIKQKQDQWHRSQ